MLFLQKQRYKNHSGITTIAQSGAKTVRLANLGMLWGFLKYYHPAVADGKYDWDQELFTLLPDVLAAANDQAAYAVIEAWVDRLGTTSAPGVPDAVAGKVKQQPEFGPLFTASALPPSLTRKLADIRDHYTAPAQHKCHRIRSEHRQPGI